MKAFIAAVAFAVVAAVGTAFVLDIYQRDSYAKFTTDGGSVRVGKPGTNLVGNG